jgi:hypothetical protein
MPPRRAKDKPILFSIHGKLQKKTNNFFSTWHDKHVTLDNKCLRYYNFDSKKKLDKNEAHPLSGFMPSSITD